MPSTATAAFAPRLVRVAPPGYTPRPYGLFSVAALTDFTDVHEANGVLAEPDPYNAAATLSDGCSAASDRVKALDPWPGGMTADPVTVYGGWSCSPVGVSQDEIEARAVAALVNGEERALEAWLATGTSTNAVAAASPWPVQTWDSTTLADDLGATEALLATEYGGVGVLHVPTAAIPALWAADVLEARGPRLVTRSGGHFVASNPYLTHGEGATEVMVTGALALRRGPLSRVGDFASAILKSTNSLDRLVERTSVVLTDYVQDAP